MRSIVIICAGLAALMVTASAVSAATTSVGLGAAGGESSSMAYSVNVTQKYEPLVSNDVIDLAPLAELGAHVWVPDGDDETVYGGFLAPGLRFTLNTTASVRPYLEGSVGGAVNSDDKFRNRRLGSHALFRSRGAVGVNFGEEFRHRLQGDYIHYSTWGLTKHNDGHGTWGVSYGYAF
ncbi:MAG: acyloxyacyl hydrolase [Desulfovibrio sp.]|nr:acyloxyacyl hydrolase [Desulfovibrio sp.]